MVNQIKNPHQKSRITDFLQESTLKLRIWIKITFNVQGLKVQGIINWLEVSANLPEWIHEELKVSISFAPDI